MSNETPAAGAGSGPVAYLSLVAVQTAGAAIVVANGVPIYRQITKDFAHHKPQPEILWWAIAALALMQTAYWLRVRLQPPMPRSAHVVIGHLAGFVARLSFILASSTFSVVFLVRFEELHFSTPRMLVLLGLLFAMFCYTLELEWLTRTLQKAEGKPRTPEQ